MRRLGHLAFRQHVSQTAERSPETPAVVEGGCNICGKDFVEKDYVVQCPKCKCFLHTRCAQVNDSKCATAWCNGRPV